MIGHPAQKVVEPAALPRRQRSEEVILDSGDQLAGGNEPSASRLSQVHGMGASVAGIVAALDQPLRFQLIDEVHHRRLVGIHDLEQLALAEIAALDKETRDGDVRDAQADRPQGLVVGRAQTAVGALKEEPGPVGRAACRHAALYQGTSRW